MQLNVKAGKKKTCNGAWKRIHTRPFLGINEDIFKKNIQMVGNSLILACGEL